MSSSSYITCLNTDYNPRPVHKLSHLFSARPVFYAIDNLQFLSIWTDYSLSHCPTGLYAGPHACETLNWLPLLNQHEEWIIIATSYHYRSDLLWFICRLIPIAQLCFPAGWMCWCSYCPKSHGRQTIVVLFLCSLPVWMMGSILTQGPLPPHWKKIWETSH